MAAVFRADPSVPLVAGAHFANVGDTKAGKQRIVERIEENERNFHVWNSMDAGAGAIHFLD